MRSKKGIRINEGELVKFQPVLSSVSWTFSSLGDKSCHKTILIFPWDLIIFSGLFDHSHLNDKTYLAIFHF